MQATPDQIRARLQAALTASSYDASSLARHIKRGQDYVRDFLNNRKESIKATDISAIEVTLGIAHGDLTRPGVSEEDVVAQVKRSLLVPGQDQTQALHARMQNFLSAEGQVDFPIFSSTDDDEGVMTVVANPMIVVSRPWFMWDVRDGFGMIISTDDAEPVFPVGVVALVNPALPAIRTSNILLQTEPNESGFKVMLRRFVGKTRSQWRVQRISDGEIEQFDRSQWPSALRVVGQVDDI